MTQHTKGPWEYRETLRKRIVEPVDKTAYVRQIAVIEKGLFVESERNAQLIASAPDMLAALEAIVAVADGSPFCPVASVVEHNNANIRKVIAKARGTV